MCPACYASIAWTIAGATSASGVTAFAVAKTIKKKKRAKFSTAQLQEIKK